MSGSPVTQPAPELPPGGRFALIVATTSYTDPALPPLRAPAADAAELAEVLADPRIGGFEVRTLADPAAQEIRMAVAEFTSGRATDDLLLIYLSCHGQVDNWGRLYFAAHDTVAGSGLPATGVESRWLVERLDECRARRQILILDCCFSGAFAAGSKGSEGSELDLRRRLIGQGRGRAVLTASDATQSSFEGAAVPGGTATGTSVFTAGLIAGLRTGAADTDHDGYVTVDDAYDYAYDHVRRLGVSQTPQHWLYGGEGKIYLARSPAGRLVRAPTLPENVQVSLNSPHPDVRCGAATVVARWLDDPDPGRVVTARHVLGEIAHSDVPQVAAHARTLLAAASAGGMTEATTAAPPPAVPCPAPARRPDPVTVATPPDVPHPGALWRGEVRLPHRSMTLSCALDEAEATIHRLADPAARACYLALLGATRADGDTQRARVRFADCRQDAAEVPDALERAEVQRYVAGVIAAHAPDLADLAAAVTEDALRTIGGIPDAERRAAVATDLTIVVTRVAPDRVPPLIDEAERCAGTIADPTARARMLLRLGLLSADVDPARGRRLVAQAQRVDGSVADGHAQTLALADLCLLVAQVDRCRAERLAGTIAHRYWREDTLAKIRNGVAVPRASTPS